MITKRNLPFFLSAIFVLLMLFFVCSIFIKADFSNMTNEQATKLNLDIAFFGAIGSVIAVALSLAAIGYSIREPSIVLSLGSKTINQYETLEPIKVQNLGNAMGNLASIFVEIEVPTTSPVSFHAPEGLAFEQTSRTDRKQFRFDDIINPKPLYPIKDAFSLIGYVTIPSEVKGDIVFKVRTAGIQGKTEKKFQIHI